MDGAARTGGALSESITVDGKAYTLTDPGKIAFMEDCEAFIIARRPNPLVEAAEAMGQLSPDLSLVTRAEQQATIREIAESAMLNRNRVSGPDVGAFLQTRSGLVFTLWRFCPQIQDIVEAGTVFKAMCEEAGDAQAQAELEARLDTVSGAVEVKNSSGPDPKVGPGEEGSSGA